MLVCYAYEDRSPGVLAFAASCALASVYGFLQGAWPFGVVEAIWAVVAVARWHKRRTVETVVTNVAFVIPGDLGLPTGGYAYDRHVLALLPACGVSVTHVALPGSYPSPTHADLAATRAALARTGKDDVLLIDGLAYGAMPADLVAGSDGASSRSSIIRCASKRACPRSERRRCVLPRLPRWRWSQRVIVTSRTTAATLAADFDVPAARITVAEPGTAPASRAKGSGGKPVRVLAVGSVVPRKGYDVLIDALAVMRALDWRLDIAGALDRSPATVTALLRADRCERPAGPRHAARRGR